MRVAKVLAVCFKNLFKLLVVHSLQPWVSLILSSSIIFVCWPTPPANSHQLSSSFDRALGSLMLVKRRENNVDITLLTFQPIFNQISTLLGRPVPVGLRFFVGAGLSPS